MHNTVALMPDSQMLSILQAALILNVSQLFLISLLEKGEIPHVLAGRRRRIREDDLFAYKRHRDERRAAALSDLAAADADLF